jgi:hypothetical protein
MPTIYSESALGIARHMLTFSAGVLVTHGLITAASTAEFEQLGIGLVTAGLGIGWSIWQKHEAKKLLVTALVEAEISEAEAKAKVADGNVPSVLTPPTEIPVPSAKL